MTLASVPAYLVDPLTGDVLSPIFLQRGDAEAARCGSELPVVDTWMANLAVFPPKQGIGWPPRTVDVTARDWTAMKLRLYEHVFREDCQLVG